MARRRRLFVEAYLANGNNASQAAIAAGAGGKQPRAESWKLLKDPVVQRLLAARAKRVAELAEMSTQTWARDLRAIAFSTIGDLVGPDGKLRPGTGPPGAHPGGHLLHQGHTRRHRDRIQVLGQELRTPDDGATFGVV